jgi:preprotein translocase subunit SecF
MIALSLMSVSPNLYFIGLRLLFCGCSVILVLCSFVTIFSQGLNYGIDFQGGILIEVRVDKSRKIGEMRQQLSTIGLGEVSLQEFGAPTDILIRVQKQAGGEKAQQVAINKVKKELGPGVKYRRTEFVGPKVSKELFRDGVLAVLLAILGILLYIWFRFEWQFGLGAIVALSHDVLTTVGIFALTGIEFNLSTVAAILTIAGYSINDTVVVFDRVRENLRKYKTLSLGELLNNSVNQTLSRTIMTSVTTLLALMALYLLGGEVISGFSFAMIWGVLIGTYSSVCLAVPLLLYLNVVRGTSPSKNYRNISNKDV